MSTTSSNEKKNYNLLIIIASIAIPAVVALLYFAPKLHLEGSFFKFLPLLNAVFNGTTAVLLIIALVAIKAKNVLLHKALMVSALVLSVLFLVSYVTYHLTQPNTHFGGEGIMRTVYFIILISHIFLAVIILPMVLVTFSRALTERFDKHKKIAKITLPLWFYVAVTGVVVYIMISPYYQ